MTLGNLTLMLTLVLVGMIFWRIRAISEYVNRYAAHYCDKNGLQLLSVARKTLKVAWKTGKLDWYTEFSFEFSSTREDRYTGVIKLKGMHVLETITPPYRIQE